MEFGNKRRLRFLKHCQPVICRPVGRLFISVFVVIVRCCYCLLSTHKLSEKPIKKNKCFSKKFRKTEHIEAY